MLTKQQYNDYLVQWANYMLTNGQVIMSMSDLIERLKLELDPIGKRVIGVVDKVNFREKECIIKDEQTKEIYKCNYDFFFNVSETDKICAYLLTDTQNYCFEKYPYVELQTDRETIIKCIMRGVKKSKMYAEDYYKYLLTTLSEFNGLFKSVHEMLSYLSMAYYRRSITNEILLILTNEFRYMLESDIKKFLFWWYKQRVVRQLYLFTLNNKEIYHPNLNMDPLEIYQVIKDDPFKILSLPIEKCEKIYSILGKKVQMSDRIQGEIARKIFEHLSKRAWTSTPSWLVGKICQEVCDKYNDPLSENERIATYAREMIKRYEMVTDEHRIYLSYSHKVESYLAKSLIDLIKKNHLSRNEIEPVFSANLDDTQKLAVKKGLNSNLSIITGGAGTGKTTVIRQIVENCDRLGIKYVVTSFTGKAVARLKEVIGNNSPSTMHMMITKKDTIEPFGHLIIDEISMVTCDLLYSFFVTFGYDYKLTLVGDQNQLLPITWGNLFSQLMSLKIEQTPIIPTVHLIKNYRSDVMGDNGILINANEILKYKQLLADLPPDEIMEPLVLKNYSNFNLVNNGEVEMVIKFVEGLKDAGINAKDIMVINPYNKDIDLINKRIQAVFDLGEKAIIDEKGYKWRINDRIMMMENNYEIGIMNGDEGVIIDLIEARSVKPQATTNEAKSDDIPKILIKFRSGIEYEFLVTYKTLDDEELDENLSKSMLEGENYINRRKSNTVAALKHAYTTTIHRSQGSEWEFGIIYLPFRTEQGSTFINANMMYTAMTRFRAAIWIIGDISKIVEACKQKPALRYDTLCYMMFKLYDEYLQDLRKQLANQSIR